MDELAFLDATALAEKIAQRELSAVELLEHYIARVERYNPEINAVVCSRYDHARARAASADAALARGENWGPLHGVPMTVKESFDLTGLPSTFGDPVLKDNIAASDAVACQRLQDAGAVIFGKTNVPIHLADLQSFNDVYGTTNNPHDVTRGPGGSSGGSAAAMAAGFSGLEMGSDIGGSIRNPAHYCGVFGLKPTWNILPMRGHAKPGNIAPGDISVIGPIARSARDLSLVLEIVGGADELQNPGWTLALPPANDKPMKDFRIAVWADDEIAPVDQSVVDRVMRVAELAKSLGARVDFDARPDFSAQHSHDVYERLLHAAMSARQPKASFEQMRSKRATLADDDNTTVARLTRASALYHREWYDANEARTRLRWAWHEFFKGYDLLLTPMCSTAAFTHDHNPKLSQRVVSVNNEQRPYMEQVFWAGLTGVSYLPSTVIPTGPDDTGLPIGVQIVAGEMRDLMTVRFAELVDHELGGFRPARNYQN